MTHREMLDVIAARASMPLERALVMYEALCEISESGVQARLELLYDLVEATDNEKIERFLAQYHSIRSALGVFCPRHSVWPSHCRAGLVCWNK
jgi:hypothetical protein